MGKITVRRAECSDCETAAGFAARVYDSDAETMAEEFRRDLRRHSRAIFLAESEGQPVGFADVSVRNDYVNGCDFSPVAFLEGIFVDEKFRNRGAARLPIDAACEWGREMGCAEFASDRLIQNELSEKFHIGVGFQETERVCYYRKILAPQSVERVDERFWSQMDKLIKSSEISIDRSRGSAHPQCPSLVCPLDHGRLEDSSGDGIEVWLGSLGDKALDAVVVTLDLLRRDSKVKLLLGCTAAEKETVLRIENSENLSAILIERP